MNRSVRLAAFCAALLLAIPASSCGPDFPFAVFVLPHGPGGNYRAFSEGRLGILQPGFHTRSLVIAFDYITHHPLSADEQQQAVATDKLITDPWQTEEEAKKSAPPSGFDTWITARSALGPVDGYLPETGLEVSRNLPGDQYEDFSNCLDNAFSTAAHTLSALSSTYGRTNPFVVEWTRGQDAVFSNCGDGKPPEFFGPGKPPSPPPPPHMPTKLPASAPAWLQQDRTYQLAAAHFYALDFDGAIDSFRAIANDQASPWSVLSRYLVARTLIREATIADLRLGDSGGTADQRAAATSRLLLILGQAQKELLSMRGDARMAPMRDDIDNLLDYVNLRLQPNAQAAVLARRLENPDTRNFGQGLIDLTWLRTDQTDASKPAPALGSEDDPTGMIAWIDDINRLDQTPNSFTGDPSPNTVADVARASADILHHWQANHSVVWLVAALMAAKPSDPAVPELIRAAAAVPPSEPAYVTVTYHRLRLIPNDDATREQLLALLPVIKERENTSTFNQFLALDAGSAPTLDAWLTTAGRLPASESNFMEQGEDLIPAASSDVCGTKIAPGTTKLFDADAANALNRDMPLRLLAASAESSVLPENLRYQVAQAAMVRAILLDRPAIVRRMTPLLVHCRSAWAPLLAAYNGSATANGRKVNGLLALMRFASTEPSVRYGEERREGFATYDSYRQNWWCTTIPVPGGTVDDLSWYTYARTPIKPLDRPLFLRSADSSEAAVEINELEKIPSASQYFATQALTWWKQNPSDPRTPDLLGEADRVLRNACRTELPYDEKTNKYTGDPHDPNLTVNLAHAIFDALHKDYPQSLWAKRYTSWE
ncbi:MAG: hypothetical protein WBY53_10940 [Acidobacteriaceae bacterium]